MNKPIILTLTLLLTTSFAISESINNSELRTPNSELNNDNSELRTPNSELPLADPTYTFIGETTPNLTGPSGSSVFEFDGSPEPTHRPQPKQRIALKADEISLSYWARIDNTTNHANIAYGVTVVPNPGYSLAPLYFALHSEKPEKLPPNKLWSNMEAHIEPGSWHHFAFIYSTSQHTFKFWLDGNLQRNTSVDPSVALPLADFMHQPLGNNFKGAISDLRIWNQVISEKQLLTFTPSQSYISELAARYTKAAATADILPKYKEWCQNIAAGLNSAKGQTVPVRDIILLQNHSEFIDTLTTSAQALNKQYGQDAQKQIAITHQVYPYSDIRRVPYLPPADGKATTAITIKGAQGEFESASITLFPLIGNAKNFHITATDLKGDNGATLPSAIIDIKAVVNWYMNYSGWDASWANPIARIIPTLGPEMLVHDDKLMIVDREKRQNLLRLSYPEGEKYVNVLDSRPAELIEEFDHDIEPVIDAKTFQPLDLQQGDFKQIWITAALPKDAKAGTYKGRLNYTQDGKEAGHIDLTIVIRPFTLPKAATRYNTDLPYYGAWMNASTISSKQSYDIAITKYRNTMRSMHQHNMDYTAVEIPHQENNDGTAEAQIAIIAEEGMSTQPIFAKAASIGGIWCTLDESERWKYRIPSEDPKPEEYTESMVNFTNSIRTTMQAVKNVLGHTDVYLYGWDEAPMTFIRQEMPFFATTMHFGGRPYVTMGGSSIGFGLAANDGGGYDRRGSRAWHENGTLIWTYGNPFSCVENPATWRRGKGLRLYMANGDGIFEYIFFEGWHIWNEFTNKSRSNWRHFNIVMPTYDGILDTLAWDGLREGFDDIRYLTLLRRLAQAAITSEDKKTQVIGKRALAWAELIDPEQVDLDQMRDQATEHIINLQTALKAIGQDTDKIAADRAWPKPTFKENPFEKAKQKGRYLDVKLQSQIEQAQKQTGTIKAQILIEAAETAQALRQKQKAEELLRQAHQEEGITPVVKQAAHLKIAQNILLKNQYNWQPTLVEIEKAQKIVDFELNGRIAKAGRDAVIEVRKAIYDALKAIGEKEKAETTGQSLIEYIGKVGLTPAGQIVCDILRDRGEDLLTQGKAKEALRIFEDALQYTRDEKTLWYRIAFAAEACGDLEKALGGYTEVLARCGKPGWGNNEYPVVEREVKRLSALVREKAPEVDNDSFFLDGDTELIELDLDE